MQRTGRPERAEAHHDNRERTADECRDENASQSLIRMASGKCRNRQRREASGRDRAGVIAHDRGYRQSASDGVIAPTELVHLRRIVQIAAIEDHRLT